MKWVALISTTLLVGITQISGEDPVVDVNLNSASPNFKQRSDAAPKETSTNNQNVIFDTSRGNFSFNLRYNQGMSLSSYKKDCRDNNFVVDYYPNNTAYYISSLYINTVGSICSCSSFNKAVLITAASCVYRKNVKSLKVIIRYERKDGRVVVSTHRVKEYHIAPKYDPVRDINNVAVLVLKKPYPRLAIYKFVLPIDYLSYKETWHIYRWLYNVKDSKYIPVYEWPDILPLTYCQKVYHEKFEKHHRCVARGGDCFSFNSLDIGTPLAIAPKYNNIRILYGIYTGIHVNHARRVHVYTDVYHLSLWIKKIVKANEPK